MAYKKKSKSEKVKQKQKQKQSTTVNVYVGTKGTGTGRKRRKAAPSHRSKPSGGVQPFYGLLNLTPPLNPSNDLGNIVDKVVSRLNVAATDRPIARGERFRQGSVPTVSIGVGTTQSGVAPIVMGLEASRVSSAGAFRPQHATSAEDIRRSPAMMAQLRERLASEGRGLTPTAQPADKFSFDIHHTGSVPSPSDATLVVPAGMFNRGLDAGSVGGETRVVGGLASALPRDDMSLLTGTPTIRETAREMELLSSESDLSEPDEGGQEKPERKKPSNLFQQHQETRIPRDFRAEGGKAPPLDYSRPTEDQYLPQMNKGGAAIRDRLLTGVVEGNIERDLRKVRYSDASRGKLETYTSRAGLNPSRTASITPQIRQAIENQLMFMEDDRRKMFV